MKSQQGAVPEFLYKYREGNIQDLEALTNREIFVPDMDQLNDIFESEFQSEVELALKHDSVHPISIFHNEVGEPIYVPVMMANSIQEDKTEERRATISQEITKARAEIRKLGIYSLSSSPKNEAMWGKYANSFKGICIEYKTTERNKNSAFMGPFEMTYEKVPPIINWALKEHYLGLRVFQLMTGFKSTKWEVEQEWRIFFKQRGLYQFPFTIESIIFGENTESDLKEKIKAIFENEVCYKIAAPKRGTYELEIINE